MHQGARTDPCGGQLETVVPTATFENDELDVGASRRALIVAIVLFGFTAAHAQTAVQVNGQTSGNFGASQAPDPLSIPTSSLPSFLSLPSSSSSSTSTPISSSLSTLGSTVNSHATTTGASTA